MVCEYKREPAILATFQVQLRLFSWKATLATLCFEVSLKLVLGV
jgi:hypothetical protein